MKEPKLRFKADDGSDFPDWEEKKLGDMFSISAGGDIDKNNSSKEKSCSYPYPVYANALMNDGLYGYANYFKVDGDTFTVTGRGDVGYAVARHCKYVPIVRLLVCRPKENDNVDFFAEQVNCARIFIESTGVPQLTAPQLAVIKLLRPSLPEQQKIADFLSTIDTIIEKQRATVSAWEERKKGVMQKLFSQEVRFKADDGSDFPDWEEKSFVNTFDSLNNSTFSRDCLNYENGSVKYIHYGDILVKYNSSVDVCDAIVPFVNEDLDCERFAILQDGDIVIADTAEDDTVGKVIEIENTSNVKTIAGLHTIACRPKEKFASKYLGYYMNSDEYHNQLRPYMQGIKVTSISKSNIALTKIMVPSLPEQQKIADCLSALDTVIQKQKETLEKWQELKKGLLQQMFV